MTKFCRFALRTTDADAARRFYTRILGHDRSVVWPLHEQALARGAQPHWLGHIGTEDVERTAAAFVERGAARLGPTLSTGDGGQAVVLRDPGGAVVAVATPPPANAEGRIDVVWHVLNTNDVARATANYAELFGWKLTDRIELGRAGSFQQFTWHAGGASVGAMADIAARPGVHPHWLFFFEVDSLEPAIATTRAAGGVVLGPTVLPSGERICVCDDPQGAAFALRERRHRDTPPE
jgi:predicted enzyme related to lactoylglutathione lyase